MELHERANPNHKETQMQVFDRDGKINFVDKNNVVLGYDLNGKNLRDGTL